MGVLYIQMWLYLNSLHTGFYSLEWLEYTVQNQGMRLNLTSMPRGQHDRIRFDFDKNMCSIVNQLRLLCTSEHYAILKIAMYWVSEWVSEWCLTPTQQFFSMARTSQFSMRWWWDPLCSRPTPLVGYCILLPHWSNSPRIDMSPHSETLSWFRDNQCLLLLLMLHA